MQIAHPESLAQAPDAERVDVLPRGSAAIADGWNVYLSRPEAAWQVAQNAIAADPETSDGWAWLLRAMAQCRMMGRSADPAAIHADFRAAREAFTRAGDERGERLACLEDAAIAMRLADWPRALAEFEMLIGLFDLNTLDADNFYLCFGLSTAYVYTGRLEESLRFGYAGLHLARQLELTAEIAAITLPLGVALMAAKDPDESDSVNELAIEMAERAGAAGLAKTLRNNRAVALRRLGRLDEAQETLDAAFASPAPMVGGEQFLHFNAAELFLRRDEVDHASAHLAKARELLVARGAVGLDWIKLHYIEGSVARARGDLAAALAAFALVDRMLPDVPALRFNDRAEFYDEYAGVLARADRPGDAFEAQRKSSRHYQSSLEIVNRVRRFAMRVRQEMFRVNAELERAAHERRALQAANRKLRTDIAHAIREADRLRDAASHDALTGLFNRAYLDRTLPGLLTLSLQSATPLALVMIDLDHFKRVNDHCGHAAGDEVLRRFGHHARGVLRGSDLVSRYGGEEFCAVLIGCGADAAHQRIGGLMAAMRAERFAGFGAAPGEVTFSAGIAVYPEDGHGVEQLMQGADRRLLRAKQRGRAQIVCGGPAPGLAQAGDAR